VHRPQPLTDSFPLRSIGAKSMIGIETDGVQRRRI
jgi:hypothetical protein